MRVWSLPKVFHTCGKNCGKSRRCANRARFAGEKSILLGCEARKTLNYRDFLWGEKLAK
jgi:hypothetical protein